ncbi:MAG: hypothetical protein ABIX12_04835 [Rubrivivax sp.]
MLRADGGVDGTPVEMANIVPAATMQRLQHWLVASKAAPLRFVASPSTVLPVERREQLQAKFRRLQPAVPTTD